MEVRFVKRLGEESGYSLVEVIVAIMLLALAIIPMVGMFDAGLRAAVLGGNYDTARTLASANLEELKARGYSDAIAAYPPGGVPGICPNTGPEGFDCEVETEKASLEDGSISSPDSSGNMLEVTVTVEWDEGDKDYQTSAVLSGGG